MTGNNGILFVNDFGMRKVSWRFRVRFERNVVIGERGGEGKQKGNRSRIKGKEYEMGKGWHEDGKKSKTEEGQKYQNKKKEDEKVK